MMQSKSLLSSMLADTSAAHPHLSSPVNSHAIAHERTAAIQSLEGLVAYQRFLAEARAVKAERRRVSKEFERHVQTQSRHALASLDAFMSSALRTAGQSRPDRVLAGLPATHRRRVERHRPRHGPGLVARYPRTSGRDVHAGASRLQRQHGGHKRPGDRGDRCGGEDGSRSRGDRRAAAGERRGILRHQPDWYSRPTEDCDGTAGRRVIQSARHRVFAARRRLRPCDLNHPPAAIPASWSGWQHLRNL